MYYPFCIKTNITTQPVTTITFTFILYILDLDKIQIKNTNVESKTIENFLFTSEDLNCSEFS